MNNGRRHPKLILIAVGVAAAMLIALSSVSALAQCAMCKSAVSNSTSAAKLARSLNLATVILFIPPVTIFCAFFFVAYRRARFQRAPEAVEAKSPGRGGSFHNARRRGLSRRHNDLTEPDTPSTLASPN